MYTWNLDRLYLGLNDPKYLSDLEEVKKLIEENIKLSEEVNNISSKDYLIKSLELQEKLSAKFGLLAQFVSLNLATDVSNTEFNNAMMALRKVSISMMLPRTKFERFVGNLENLEEIIESDEFLREYRFMLLEIKDNAKYLLSDAEELLASELNQSGGSLHAKLHGELTSNLLVEFRGKSISLSQVRNLAYETDPLIRKEAYEAELKAYDKISKATSFALHGIKKEVLTMTKKRSFNHPLDRTLLSSRLTKGSLDALLEAMKEYLPHFRRYLKQKAKLLSHKDGLPFYDLFAPIGAASKKYSIEEAQEFIVKHFASYAFDLADMAKEAFKNNWVDYLPKEGKRGGAFCSGIYSLKESRILTNYAGSIGDISTLAHELGHAYHNYHLNNERILNSYYPMPLAETASILCETIVKKNALELASSKEEKIGLLEQELQDSTQVIVDIYSRYLFEDEVFCRSENEFLNEKALDEIMKRAQITSYGDGLNKDFLHPRMWINKGHYYSTGRSYYNFPYAFGLLFAKGVYAKFKENGPSYSEKIAKLLRMTGKASIAEVAKSIDIDINSVDYWKGALEVIKEDIDEFINLSK